MKANELMIGDWVRMPFGVPEIRQIKYPSEINDADFYEPIPLTAEILQANGFDCSDEEVVRYNFTDGDYQGHFSLRRMYSGNTPNGWSFFAFNVLTIIDSIHKLQHAMKLCGIEKEIVL
jgi:hypothetical protein